MKIFVIVDIFGYFSELLWATSRHSALKQSSCLYICG